MNERIKDILSQMQHLEAEFHREVKDCEGRFQQQLDFIWGASKKLGFDIDGKQTEYASYSLIMLIIRHTLSIPFIYGMIIPLALLDLSVSIYQSICFRLYGIPRVKRSEHMVIDRQYLFNLGPVDRFNCIYCGYGNGVISYAREIVSKTEQYWCPIKHAKNILNSSERYNAFLEYGDTEEFHKKRKQYREESRNENETS